MSERLLRRLPHDRVAADERERGVPRPHRDREVERGDDADDARAGATAPSSGGPGAPRRSSARRAGGRARPRSRRCRSSPAPRRAPRSGSCRPRATRARRDRPCARAAARRARGRARRGPARARCATCGTPRRPAPTASSTCGGRVRAQAGELAAGDRRAGNELRPAAPDRCEIGDAETSEQRAGLCDEIGMGGQCGHRCSSAALTKVRHDATPCRSRANARRPTRRPTRTAQADNRVLA